MHKVMYKVKLNNKSDFDSFLDQSRPYYYIYAVDECEPKSYPTVMMYFEVENSNLIKNDLYYIFIYKEDFV